MSAKHLKDLTHSSNLIVKPFTRALIAGIFGYLGYCVLSDGKQVERVRPNYEEYRRLKGLPEVELKHPFFGVVKELRIIPKEEEKKIRN